MSDEWLQTISERYIQLYEKVIGEKFKPQPLTEDEIEGRVRQSLKKIRG